MCQSCRQSQIWNDCTGFDRSKCNARIAIAYFTATLALCLMCASFAFPYWYDAEVKDSNDDAVGRFSCGLTSYRVESYSNGMVETGPLSDLPSSDFRNSLIDGGRKVYALSIPALLVFVAGFVLLGIYRFNKTAVSYWYAVLGLLCHLLGMLFQILAVLLYDSELYLGHSYLIFLAAGLNVVIAFLIQFWMQMQSVINPEQQRSWMRVAVIVAELFIAVCMACAGLATLSWIVIKSTDENYMMYVGLKKWQLIRIADGDVMQSGSTDSLPAGWRIYDSFDVAGDYALGFGIVGIFCGVAAAVCATLAVTGRKDLYWPSFGLTALTGLFMLLGAFLYAKQLFMGWALSVYTVTPFLMLVTLVLILLVLLAVATPGEQPATFTAGSTSSAPAAAPAGSVSADSGYTAPVVPQSPAPSAPEPVKSTAADPYAMPGSGVTVSEAPPISANPFDS